MAQNCHKPYRGYTFRKTRQGYAIISPQGRTINECDTLQNAARTVDEREIGTPTESEATRNVKVLRLAIIA